MIRISPPCSSSAPRGRPRSRPRSDGWRRERPCLRRRWSHSPEAVRPPPCLARLGTSRVAFRCRRCCRSSPRRAGRSRRCCVRMSRPQPSLVLLDDPLQILAHLGYGLARHLHLAARSPANDDIELAISRILVRKVVAKVRASTLLSFEGAARDDLRDGDHVLEIERRVPSGIVLAVAPDGNFPRSLSQNFEGVQRAPDLLLAPHDPDELLHHRLEIVLHVVRPFPSILSVEGLQRGADDGVRLLRIDPG